MILGPHCEGRTHEHVRMEGTDTEGKNATSMCEWNASVVGEEIVVKEVLQENFLMTS